MHARKSYRPHKSGQRHIRIPSEVPSEWTILRPDFPKGLVGARQHLRHLLIGVLVKGAKHLAIEWIHGLIRHADCFLPKVFKSAEHG
jgi:hypothetical protein